VALVSLNALLLVSSSRICGIATTGFANQSVSKHIPLSPWLDFKEGIELDGSRWMQSVGTTKTNTNTNTNHITISNPTPTTSLICCTKNGLLLNISIDLGLNSSRTQDEVETSVDSVKFSCSVLASSLICSSLCSNSGGDLWFLGSRQGDCQLLRVELKSQSQSLSPMQMQLQSGSHHDSDENASEGNGLIIANPSNSSNSNNNTSTRTKRTNGTDTTANALPDNNKRPKLVASSAGVDADAGDCTGDGDGDGDSDSDSPLAMEITTDTIAQWFTPVRSSLADLATQLNMTAETSSSAVALPINTHDVNNSHSNNNNYSTSNGLADLEAGVGVGRNGQTDQAKKSAAVPVMTVTVVDTLPVLGSVLDAIVTKYVSIFCSAV
jgi:hypothetical protein